MGPGTGPGAPPTPARMGSGSGRCLACVHSFLGNTWVDGFASSPARRRPPEVAQCLLPEPRWAGGGGSVAARVQPGTCGPGPGRGRLVRARAAPHPLLLGTAGAGRGSPSGLDGCRRHRAVRPLTSEPGQPGLRERSRQRAPRPGLFHGREFPRLPAVGTGRSQTGIRAAPLPLSS